MAAHEWTRARQRSVSGGAGPPESAATPTPPEPPPAGPAEAGDEPPDEPAEDPVGAEAPADVDAPPAPDADDAAATDVRPEAEGPAPAPAPDPRPVVAAPPAAGTGPRVPKASAPASESSQTTLPLGLEPLPAVPPKRTATETREDLIQRLLDPHLTLQETAKLLDVCPTTVRRYTNRGLLAHYRTPGNQRRFRLSDVLSFMERQGMPALGLERKRSESNADGGIEPEDTP